MSQLVVKVLPYYAPCEIIFSHLAHEPWGLLLDSNAGVENGRYSYIVTAPFLRLEIKDGLVYLDDKLIESAQPIEIIKSLHAKYTRKFKELTVDSTNIDNLPPFCGGMAGLFSYTAVQYLENISTPKDELAFPDVALGFYALVIAFDRVKKQILIIGSDVAQEPYTSSILELVDKCEKKILSLMSTSKINIEDINLTCLVDGEIKSNFTHKTYATMLEEVIEYIYAGDIFQANLAQRFLAKANNDFSSYHLYLKARQLSPTNFSCYFNLGKGKVLASLSPERFIKVENRLATTKPIKGTAKRSKDPIEDLSLGNALLASEKDNAENTMIVDLMRNDFSLCCENFSVKVLKLCELETFANVHHLVSTIEGKLSDKYSALDLLLACFPGGSITGAPKVRAMQIIAELETVSRGPYCGSIVYLGFNGNMDSSIIIRSYAIVKENESKKENNDNKDDNYCYLISFHAGGGIVADSTADLEYEETLLKAKLLHQALEQ